MAFPDYFSKQAADYARHRPRYPAALFDHLAALAPCRDLAWDCATGNGQAAVALAERFERVVASDASADQLRHAEPHPRVAYHVARAEDVPSAVLAAESVDLVTVAQAMHWLDPEPFYAQARRVLKPGGVVAVWGYYGSTISPPIDGIIHRFSEEIVADFWPPRVGLLRGGFLDLPFPFDEIESPAFEITADWRIFTMLGYLRSWSPTQRYIDARGENPVDRIRSDLMRAWGAGTVRPVRWPLGVRIGRWNGP